MRTIKDPKKKPEVRRRADYEVEEETCRSNKSTPPKKRKSAKSSKDDSSSFNDSSSCFDNQSDILSEKSSAYGDDTSDVSSLKSTPPKKRSYSKIVNKSPDINGDIHPKLDGLNKDQDGKVKGSKKNEKKMANESAVKDSTSKKGDVEKKGQKGKKKVDKEPVPEKLEKKQVKDGVSSKGKKSQQTKDVCVAADSHEEKTLTKKKGSIRKRKVTGDEEENEKIVPAKQSKSNKKEKKAESTKEDTNTAEIQSKNLKKSKRQLKAEATLELKRQTEEQRNSHSILNKEPEKNSKKKKVVSKKKDQNDKDEEENCNEKSELRETTEETTGNNDKIESNTADDVLEQQSDEQKSQIDNSFENKDTCEPIITSESIVNNAYLGRENDDESSDLDTSFESINSVHDNLPVPDRKEENNDINNDIKEKDKLNDSLESKHEDKVDLNLNIKCERCGYVSRSKGGHTRHLRKCQPELVGVDGDPKNPKVHICEKCDYTAPRRVLVINHMKTHGIYQCKRCQFRTDSEETLDEHSVLEHKDRSDCKFCKLCNRYVKCSEIPIEKHMEECKGRIPFQCPECSKEFQYESSLKCHVVSHYPDQPKLFSCDQCDYKSNYKANLKKHIRHIHEQRGEKTIKCTDCEKLFRTEDNMRRHQKLHSDERPHKCEMDGCDKAFKTLNGLKLHLVSHQTERPFTCEVEGCRKGFKSKKSLAMHLNETHQNAPKNFHCSVEGCDMAFYKKCHFERHMAAHTDNRMFFCRWITCTKAFRTAESLKTHWLVHTDEKPLKCSHCDYTCRQRSSLRFHMKKKHPEFLLSADLSHSNKTTLEGSQLSPSHMPSNLSNSNMEVKLDKNSDNKENLHDTVKSEPFQAVQDISHKTSQDNDTDNHHEFPSVVDSHSESSLNHEDNKPSKNHLASSNDKETVPSVEETKESTPVTKKHEPEPLHKGKDRSLQEKKLEKLPKADENPVKKPKKTDMYEFMSEDESEDDMKPGLLRKEYSKDKPPLPPVTGSIDPSLLSDLNLPPIDKKKSADDKQKKVKKKPGPKPKPKPETEGEVKLPKKRGRKRKSETEKVEEDDDVSDSTEIVKVKPKRGRSPKHAKELNTKKKGNDAKKEKEEVPAKKKRGPNKTGRKSIEKETEKVPKKRGRKKKVKESENKDIEPENGDATINYSEVESDKLFADSKDGVSDQAEAPLSNVAESIVNHDNSDKEDESNFNNDKNENNEDDQGEKIEDASPEKTEENIENKAEEIVEEEIDTNEVKDSLSDKADDTRNSDADSESSDIGSDFDEDLKPPPAPRPPPMYDSEDGDIESGPENEDFNGSFRSNERIRDFESSREISKEISRDFESSREIDDSVKTSDANSVETATPKDTIGTPSSVNPYKNDSVGNDLENQETPHPHSHHSSLPHTPSHSSIPPTPITNQEYESQTRVEESVIKSANVQGQTNDENTDESSMPEVDKDYVGRFFEEIQCNPQPDQIGPIPSITENSKPQDKVVESQQNDSTVPSSLNSNHSDASIQMQSPPTDLSQKRMDILPSEPRPEEPYQTRSHSVHRISDGVPSVPTFDPQFNSIDPYASSSLPSRDTILKQTDQSKISSPLNASTPFMRFSDSETMLQRQRMSTAYDRNIQNLHRITDTPMSPHNSASPLLRHVAGREDVFPGSAGVPGSMSRNPFHSSWPSQDVRPPHWTHPTYLQRPLDQQTGSTSSSLFGKDSYLPPRDFMFDPSRAAAERNMFSSLASSHSQRPDIAHDTFPLERFDLGSYLSSHAYSATPSLPVDYTRSAHGSTQKSLDERYRQSSTGVSEFRTLPQSSTASEMFGMNSSFNLDKFYPRESMYHSQHISDNTNNPFLQGVAGQHSMFSREYTHRSFYTQNSPYPFMNMNDKNYSAASAKLGHSASAVGQQRELVPVPRPNMAHDPQLQDPYRHSSMIYNMMNRYFE